MLRALVSQKIVASPAPNTTKHSLFRSSLLCPLQGIPIPANYPRRLPCLSASSFSTLASARRNEENNNEKEKRSSDNNNGNNNSNDNDNDNNPTPTTEKGKMNEPFESRKKVSPKKTSSSIPSSSSKEGPNKASRPIRRRSDGVRSTIAGVQPAPWAIPSSSGPTSVSSAGDSSTRSSPTGETSEEILTRVMESVIKIYVTSSPLNYELPWQNKPLSESLGSGFVIEGRQIITNAHVVADAMQVMVKKPTSFKKYIARVVASGHECDLALLEVDDPEFWGETTTSKSNKSFSSSPSIAASSSPPSQPCLEFSTEIPNLQDTVMVVGYPMGGDNVCLTQGVVSRVEPVYYAHTGSHLLAVQIDAAINPGNSGGPALVEGKVVGVAFQNIQNASSIGYVIPIPVIRHFLTDVRYGGYKVENRGATRVRHETLLEKLKAERPRQARKIAKRREDVWEKWGYLPAMTDVEEKEMESTKHEDEEKNGENGEGSEMEDRNGSLAVPVAIGNPLAYLLREYDIVTNSILDGLAAVSKGDTLNLPNDKLKKENLTETTPTSSISSTSSTSSSTSAFTSTSVSTLPAIFGEDEIPPFKLPYSRGFCATGFLCQESYNPSLQHFLGLLPASRRTLVDYRISTMYPEDSASRYTGDARHNFAASVLHFPSMDMVRKNSPTTLSSPEISTETKSKSTKSTKSTKSVAATTATAATAASRKPSSDPTTPMVEPRALGEGEDLLTDLALTGVAVNSVYRLSPCRGILRRNDVLLAIDGKPVANDGTVVFRGHERIGLDYLFSLKYAGETARLTFLRRLPREAEKETMNGIHGTTNGDGEIKTNLHGGSYITPKPAPNAALEKIAEAMGVIPEALFPPAESAMENELEDDFFHPDLDVAVLEADVKLAPIRGIVKPHGFDDVASYLVVAGVVFAPLSVPFLQEFGSNWFTAAPRSLVAVASSSISGALFPSQEAVVITQVLPDETTVGYTSLQDVIVRKVNGVTIKNMRHLRYTIEKIVIRAALEYELRKGNLTNGFLAHARRQAEAESKESAVTVFADATKDFLETVDFSEDSPFADYLRNIPVTRYSAPAFEDELMQQIANPGKVRAATDGTSNTKKTKTTPVEREDHESLFIELADERIIVLNLAESFAQHQTILNKHNVTHYCSLDLIEPQSD